jgi:class 3 adenylate cyclase
MTEVIMAYGGTIDEFLGDAILAVFGAPKEDPQHALKAVQCALAMQSAVADVNTQNASSGLPRIETGIALNTGTVVAGNIGSERRAKYGFVGSPMNVTARIEDLCDANEILISEATRLAAGSGVSTTLKGEFAAKGIEQKLRVHTVINTDDTA